MFLGCPEEAPLGSFHLIIIIITIITIKIESPRVGPPKKCSANKLFFVQNARKIDIIRLLLLDHKGLPHHWAFVVAIFSPSSHQKMRTNKHKIHQHWDGNISVRNRIDGDIHQLLQESKSWLDRFACSNDWHLAKVFREKSFVKSPSWKVRFRILASDAREKNRGNPAKIGKCRKNRWKPEIPQKSK